MDKVHVVLAANGLYEPGLELTRASIVASAGDAGTLVFHEFREWPKGLNLPRNLSLAYLRLLLPNLLPDEDFVIWSDVDTLWKRDVRDLWAKRDANVLIVAPHDRSPETIQSEGEWMKSHGYPFDADKYFCSGVMLINLKKMREVRFVDRCLAFVVKHDDVLLADQSVLNALFFDEVQYLDNSWNVFSRDATMEHFRCNGSVIHYAGETPWLFRDAMTMLTDTRIEWFRAYADLVGKCSVHDVMRRYIGSAGIVLRRLLFRLAANPVTWPLVCGGLLVTGRLHVAKSMRIWARRI